MLLDLLAMFGLVWGFCVPMAMGRAIAPSPDFGRSVKGPSINYVVSEGEGGGSKIADFA